MKKFLMALLILLLLTGCAKKENTADVAEETSDNSNLLGRWEGCGYEYNGMMLDPTGEWIEFESDSRGTLFIINEYPFEYTVDGDTIAIKEDVGLNYTAKIDGDQIILDNGMLYYFSRDAKIASSSATTDESMEEESSLDATTSLASLYDEYEEGTLIFESVSCLVDDENYFSEGEILVLFPDGTGTFNFVGTTYDIDWVLEEDDFLFVDESGDFFEGSINDNQIEGTYTVSFSEDDITEYDYIYQLVE